MKVKDLLHRYQLKTRHTLTARFKKLDITLLRDRRGHRYASPEQIAQLDDLHDWLSDGGSMDTYDLTPTSLSVLSAADQTDDITTIDTPAVAAVEPTELRATDLATPDHNGAEESLLPVLTQLLYTLQAPQPTPRSPLYVWEQLEQACEKGWRLTTSQVKELTGMNPHGDVCEYGVFSFQRHGKIGRETSWEVWKNGY